MRYKNIKNNTKMKRYATVCKLSKYTVYYALKKMYIELMNKTRTNQRCIINHGNMHVVFYFI